MKKLAGSHIAGLAALLILFLATAALGATDPLLQPFQAKVIDAQTVNGAGEVCSDVQTVLRVHYLSLQWQAASASGTANVRIYLQASLDDTNFAVPQGVSDVSPADTSEAWNLAGVYIPFARQIKVCVKGNAGNPTDTVATVWLGIQPG